MNRESDDHGQEGGTEGSVDGLHRFERSTRWRIARDRSHLSLLQSHRHFTSIFFSTTLVSLLQHYKVDSATTFRRLAFKDDREDGINDFSDLEMIVRMLPVSSRSPLNPPPLDIQLSTQCCLAAPALNVASTVNLLEGNRRTFSSKSLPETSSPSSLGLHFLLPKKVTRSEAHSSQGKLLEFVYLFQTEISLLPPLFPYLLPCSRPFLYDSTRLF